MAKRKDLGGDHFDFIGFAPDAPPDTPGACQVMDNAIPTPRGWRAAPTEQTAAMLNHGTLTYPVIAYHAMLEQFNAAYIVEGRSATAGGAATLATATIHASYHPSYTSAPTSAAVTGEADCAGGWQLAQQPIFLN